MENKTMILVDNSLLEKILSEQIEIKKRLIEFKVIPPPEYLTSFQFMEKVSIGRWKLDMLINSGLLDCKKIGKKIYIKSTMVQKYFDGEMVLK